MRDNGDEETTDDGRQETRRLVLNPVSGGGGHAERARRLAESYGFSIAETDHAGHGVELPSGPQPTGSTCLPSVAATALFTRSSRDSWQPRPSRP
ncbi:hypothetical protein [Halalkalicoccus salilacus]|uniref:hypothetical protein n=1 Tax=Halalkalicoccus sp. GCM10025704 TaxID=3252662 RepID=UPI00360D93E8